MLNYEQQQTYVANAEAVMNAALTRRTELVALRAEITIKTANNELSIVQARAKVKDAKKYVKDLHDWLDRQNRSWPNANVDDLIKQYPHAPPQ